MTHYYVSDNAQNNGGHEVHKIGCNRMPDKENRTYLGLFETCRSAVTEAQKHYSKVDGCYYCSKSCHTQ